MNLDLAVIGNCQIGALIDQRARIVWSCMPRPDSDPVFCALLGGADDATPAQQGLAEVVLADLSHTEQFYLDNTAIVVTRLHDLHGNCVEIRDFAPRFYQYGRTFRPVMLVRSLRPVAGTPRIRIRLRPSHSWGEHRPEVTFGSNHVRYVMPHMTLRLTTDASVATVLDEASFLLNRPLHLLLGPDETLPEAPEDAAARLFTQTRNYWRNWVRSLAIPFEWQDAVIRAAITLKLCTFEDTGAVLAALTTSIPEAANSGRNWDYRYCWLRDSYFTVHALNRLGATKTMEAYLGYIVNVSSAIDPQNGLQPVYGLDGRSDLDELIADGLPGYRGMGPVRVGNQAWLQVQNDVYGAVVLATAQYFFDRRLDNGDRQTMLEMLEPIGAEAERRFLEPDAGLWEYRGRKRVHTYSAVMCWAACDRLARIATHLDQLDTATRWRTSADRIHAVICREAWDPEQRSFTESFGRPELDASMLILHELGFLSASDPRFIGTVEAVEKQLRRGNYLFRYNNADDFGEPENAFNICTFWYINALAAIGRQDEARALFEHMLAARNPLGLLSEDIDPATGELWGNFPQTYSMVGIINGAMRLSRRWEDEF